MLAMIPWVFWRQSWLWLRGITSWWQVSHHWGLTWQRSHRPALRSEAERVSWPWRSVHSCLWDAGATSVRISRWQVCHSLLAPFWAWQVMQASIEKRIPTKRSVPFISPWQEAQATFAVCGPCRKVTSPP
jgi:hypothetical protein